MVTAPLEFITVPATTKHTATVIFIHGLGDSGNGWKPVADSLKQDPALTHVKWVLPHSPTRKVTANVGVVMPSWFDIYSFGFNTIEDEQGMLESASSIGKLITAEVEAGLDASRIVLGGFSQGAAMTFLTGLTGERKLAGLIALSGWLPLRNKFKQMVTPRLCSMPIFVGHGSLDELVKIDYANTSITYLQEELKMEVTEDSTDVNGISFNVYDGLGHSTNPKELQDMKTWLVQALPKTED